MRRTRRCPAIGGDYLLAVVPHFAADDFARLAIDLLLFRRELVGRRTAARGAFPAGQYLVARLRVEMTVAVDAVNADALTLGAKVRQVVAVSGIGGGHQAPAFGGRPVPLAEVRV